MSLKKCIRYETKNIRLSLHLLKKTNILGPLGPNKKI